MSKCIHVCVDPVTLICVVCDKPVKKVNGEWVIDESRIEEEFIP